LNRPIEIGRANAAIAQLNALSQRITDQTHADWERRGYPPGDPRVRAMRRQIEDAYDHAFLQPNFDPRAIEAAHTDAAERFEATTGRLYGWDYKEDH
jgi:hypothetical protein